MKIGIITWFLYNNYGSKLQAIALQRYLRNLGHDVWLINFPPPKPAKFRRRVKFLDRALNSVTIRIARRVYHGALTERSERLEHAMQTYCNLTEPIGNDADFIRICNRFDLLIAGSDQIWNPNFYHPYYYAAFPDIKPRKVSYAPSLGIQEIPKEKQEPMRKAIETFSYVTVREKAGALLLEKLLGYRPQTALDPTMLLTKKDWMELLGLQAKEGQKYALCYFLTDNRTHWHTAAQFAKEKRLELRIIPYMGLSYFCKGKKYMDAGVWEFLDLILNAEYVLTDSFHGTVFSLLFQKEVYTFTRFRDDKDFSQNDRVRELAAQMHIGDHLLPFNARKVPNIPPIRYEEMNQTLGRLRKRSEAILREELVE